MKLVGYAVLGLFAVGCAASTPTPEAVSTTTLTAGDAPVQAKQAPATQAASTDAPTATATPTDSTPAPTTCGGEQAFKDAKACLFPADFAKKLCSASYPDVTLSLFTKGTPWTRAWLAGDVEAWSASGGFTSRANLAFDEEVIILARHNAPSVGGIVMSGAGANFDVLRWDGSCVSVQEGELTAKRPPAPKPATMRFSRFEEATQRALLASSKVKTSRDARDKACNGAKEVCEKAEKEFASAIAVTVRTGGAQLPAPSRHP